VNNFGNVTIWGYDSRGRKSWETQVLTPTGMGDGQHIGATTTGESATLPIRDPAQGSGDGKITTIYTYRPNGQIYGLVDDNNNRSQWAYDSQGRKILETKGSAWYPHLADWV